jgi:hypothetical protein
MTCGLATPESVSPAPKIIPLKRLGEADDGIVGRVGEVETLVLYPGELLIAVPVSRIADMITFWRGNTGGG